MDSLLPLLNGKPVQSDIDIGISYKDLDDSLLALNTYLLSSGYLTINNSYDDFYELMIPNKEIKQVFEREIRTRYLKKEQIPLIIQLKRAFNEGDEKTLENIIREYLLSSFSYFEMKNERLR